MKYRSPKSLALITSGLVTLVVLLVLFFSYLLSNSIGLVTILLIVSTTMLASYIIFYLVLERFINKRIKLIYKNIHNLKMNKGNGSDLLNMNKDVLREVNREVLDWASNSKKEIEDLRAQESYRREFIGNVSHELKTPIFNIQGYLLTLLEGGLEDPKINKDYLSKANRNVDRMISIVNDLDSISRLDSGDMSVEPEPFNIVDLAKEVYELQELKANEAQVQLIFKELYDKPIIVEADKDRVRQVLVNLVVNSIKYGKEGGTTEIRFHDMDENILVEVADNGPGIQEDHLPRLFERFYRVDKSRSRDRGGTGLGLAIVKHIIEAHQQTINVRSTQGVGSTFSFTLKKGKL